MPTRIVIRPRRAGASKSFASFFFFATCQARWCFPLLVSSRPVFFFLLAFQAPHLPSLCSSVPGYWAVTLLQPPQGRHSHRCSIVHYLHPRLEGSFREEDTIGSFVEQLLAKGHRSHSMVRCSKLDASMYLDAYLSGHSEKEEEEQSASLAARSWRSSRARARLSPLCGSAPPPWVPSVRVATGCRGLKVPG